jgi:hypothetical protein
MTTHEHQERLDRAQVLLDLDQAIADREQAIVDFAGDQIESQETLDGEWSLLSIADMALSSDLSSRQDELDRIADRGVARQHQLDQAQTARDDLQDLIDRQQQAIELSTASVPTAERLALSREARRAAIVLAATHAGVRVEAADRRAERAGQRAQALADRAGMDGSADS